MSKYAALDALIVQSVTDGRHPFYNVPCRSESERLADDTYGNPLRIIEGRLQSLRRNGILDAINGGWKVVA